MSGKLLSSHSWRSWLTEYWVWCWLKHIWKGKHSKRNATAKVITEICIAHSRSWQWSVLCDDYAVMNSLKFWQRVVWFWLFLQHHHVAVKFQKNLPLQLGFSKNSFPAWHIQAYLSVVVHLDSVVLGQYNLLVDNTVFILGAGFLVHICAFIASWISFTFMDRQGQCCICIS